MCFVCHWWIYRNNKKATLRDFLWCNGWRSRAGHVTVGYAICCRFCSCLPISWAAQEDDGLDRDCVCGVWRNSLGAQDWDYMFANNGNTRCHIYIKYRSARFRIPRGKRQTRHRPSIDDDTDRPSMNAEVLDTTLYGCVTWNPRPCHYDSLRLAYCNLLARETVSCRNARASIHNG